MTIYPCLRALAAALTALTVLCTSAGFAHAEPKDTHPQPNLCALFEPTDGSWDFYLPGEVVTIMVDGVGHRVECGADGKWIILSRPKPPTTVRPVAPRPVSAAR